MKKLLNSANRFLWGWLLILLLHTYVSVAQPTLPSPREFYVIYQDGHFLAHNATFNALLPEASSFDISTCVWERDADLHWDVNHRHLIPTNPESTPGVGYMVLCSDYWDPGSVFRLSTPVLDDRYLFLNVGNGNAVQRSPASPVRYVNYDGTNWVVSSTVGGSLYALEQVDDVTGGSLSVDKPTVHMDYTTTTTTVTAQHTMPSASVLYYQCNTGDAMWYSPHGATVHTPPTASTPLSCSFEWSLSGDAATYLSVSGSSTTATLTRTSYPPTAVSGTLTLTVRYDNGSTRTAVSTVTVEPEELFFVIHHGGHLLGHSADGSTVSDNGTGATAFNARTALWKFTDMMDVYNPTYRYLQPHNGMTASTGSYYLSLQSGNNTAVVSPQVWACQLATVPSNGSTIDGTGNGGNGPKWDGSNWTNTGDADRAVVYSAVYHASSLSVSSAGALAVDDRTFSATGSQTLSLTHTAPTVTGTPAYWQSTIAGSTYYYYEDAASTAHYALPTSTNTALSVDHFSWALSDETYLSLASSNTGTTASNSISCTGIPASDNHTATLTVTAHYTDGSTRSASASITVNATPPPAAPAISVSTACDTPNDFTITNNAADATVYYTIDGSDPSTSATRTSFTATTTSGTMTSSATIRAVAMRDGVYSSEVTHSHTMRVPGTPTYTREENILTINSGSYTAQYSTNGGSTWTTGASYTNSTSAAVSLTIRLTNPGWNPSCTTKVTVPYLPSGQMHMPSIVVAPDNKIVIAKEDNGVKVNLFFTTDGSTPQVDASGNPVGSTQRYTNRFSLTGSAPSTATVKAIATNSLGGGVSAVNTLTVNLVDRTSQISDLAATYLLVGTPQVDATVGTETAPFTGALYGGLLPISATRPVIGYAEGATIGHIVIDRATISAAGNVGAVVCNALEATRVFNCGVLNSESTVATTDGGAVGSIAGKIEDLARIINCYSFATVSGSNVETTAGIVGNNTFATTQSNVKTMVMNCMFYGQVASGYAVYGGQNISNNGANGVNNYNYYLDGAVGTLAGYHCTWPVEEQYLTRFEYYRPILNGNRGLASWWVFGTFAREECLAKWVLDPSVAPYPILKAFDTYPSTINQDPLQVMNAAGSTMISRSDALPYQGRKLGQLQVTVQAGAHHAGSGSASITLSLPITDMDTLHHDFNYYKVQLPYYNTTFGNPSVYDHANRYAGNYTDYVVTGWKITGVVGGTPGTFEKHWEHGYNFADRFCTNKDLYSVSGRVFAQGGYYYVPEGVTAITIEAYWGKAVYLECYDHMNELVDVSNGNNRKFAPAGTWSAVSWPSYDWSLSDYPHTDRFPINGQMQAGTTVYDQAVVLLTNRHHYNKASDNFLCDGDGTKAYTITTTDLDFDNEPDHYFALEVGSSSTETKMPQLRFDFVPVPDLGMAAKIENTVRTPSVGVLWLRGHFEVTETSIIHFSEFRYDGRRETTKLTSPLILMAGQFNEFISTLNGDADRTTNHTEYIIVGGHIKMRYMAEGCHNLGNNSYATRHCAISLLGGEYGAVYLSGIENSEIANSGSKYVANEDNPHIYTNGGHIGLMAGAGSEAVNGDVVFSVDHSIIGEFYGGGINSVRKVRGSIRVTINNSIVSYYCGGPQTGDMNDGQTITTSATNTCFGRFFGAGNGGTCYVQTKSYDNQGANSSPGSSGDGNWWMESYTPLSSSSANSFQAKYRFSIWSIPPGDNTNHPARTYLYNAVFSATTSRDVSSTLNGCTVLTDFYGAGNLGGVQGNVTSTLTDTRVLGNAYGAGYSAAIPSFWVYTKDNLTLPHRDGATGICYDGVVGDSVLYTWSNTETTTPIGSAVRNDPTIRTNYLKTSASLENLGAVHGDVHITITGNSRIEGSVFGGGNQSRVEDNTVVNITGNSFVVGNVYGGGNRGAVGGNTEVNIGRK
ncbi:MAG: chitobiase/beta-hexosaminidase C-terminal domain-containing protein [Bacteroidales bacterium]|nr:chitobiase/beta-hexosaminidase C-terminal domain-containing protein [Bacteroidales bacterium]